ncbi:MAG: phosphoribosylanthranilate isomerase [Treponema sp.]|jgi:phosphoribosylanthranilate isomerase|nr:phosphoribosylanthranilate isomerase [Treponema sp.]
MRIKICGLSRDEDIDYVNEGRPDFAGFVFAPSKRQVSAPLAQYLRFRLADGIIPVGVFVNSPISFITELYQNGVISIAQLHGNEDENYILRLKEACGYPDRSKKGAPFKVIKVIKSEQLKQRLLPTCADFLLIDSGAGTGKAFDWESLKSKKFKIPWFLAGGINLKNIKQAFELNPFAVDVSSGAETDGFKNREKILQLIAIARKGNKHE